MDGSGSLEEQFEALCHKANEIRARRGDLKKIEELGATLEEHLILDNRYTEHSTVGLAQQWDQLDQLAMRMQHNLKQQIQARNQSGVSEDSLKEFSMMFKHFDKDKSGKLNHQEFKSCLRALGYDLPMVEEGQPEKVEEEEAWITEKQQLLSVEDYGDSMAAVQGLMKKHDAFETDFAVHRDRCSDIRDHGQTLVTNNNHHGDSISQRCVQLDKKLENLQALATRRKTALMDNFAYLQFMWKADVVESWIADKENHVKSEEFGRDLSTVQTLLTKQETFDAGMYVCVLGKLRIIFNKENSSSSFRSLCV